jgi:hypothetical protein
VLQVASVAGGTVALQWAATTGRRYQLQSTTNLTAASWSSEGTPLNGAGGLLTNNLPIGAQPSRFFRLLLMEN